MRAALAFLLLAAGSVSAQMSETVTVEVTSVDVIVTDAKGLRVGGLSKGDFEISVDGKRREITNVSEMARLSASIAVEGVETPAAAPPRAATMVPAPARRFLIFVDNHTLTTSHRRSFVAAARTFVDQHVRSGDQVMIVTATGSLATRLPWTSDISLVKRGLDDIATDAATNPREVDRRRLEDQLRDQILQARLGESSGRGTVMTFESLVLSVRNFSSSEKFHAMQTIDTLNTALRLFPPTGERKILLMAGEGMPTHPGEDMWRLLDDVRRDTEGARLPPSLRTTTRSPILESMSETLAPELRKLGENAFRRGIVIYTLNPGEAEKLDVDQKHVRNKSQQFTSFTSAASGYQTLASETGGAAFNGTTASFALSRIAGELESYYSVGLRGSVDENQTIAIRAKGGHRVRFTLASGAPSRDQIVSDIVVANHLTRPGSNDMQIAVFADAVLADGEKRKVPLKIVIPVASLTLDREGNELTGGFNIYVASGDARGASSNVNKQTHLIRWPASAPAQMPKHVMFAVDVILEPGRNQISVGVLDQRSERTGFQMVGGL